MFFYTSWRSFSQYFIIHYFVFDSQIRLTEAVAQRFSVEKVFLKISHNSQENTCARVSFKACNFIKKETLAQVFSCEFLRNF